MFWSPSALFEWLWQALIWVFGAIGFVCLVVLANEKPYLVVDEAGICAAHWISETITWQDFEDVFVQTSSDGDYLCLTLRCPEEYLAAKKRLARLVHTANRQTGFGDLTIKPSAVSLDANELLQIVRRQIAKSRSEPKPPRSSVKYGAV
jgi:hypothetical protein